ncbi:BatA and WFA domain-containing protein [Clostridium estertheticum]|uniref:vWA domain-containing protein n=1 Tax=Clostridium estertheticum TaxID=238834 RepID=UPI0013E980CF|nr:BatA and WFA domain-containing protein [Clostridium estertheticum]MBZ9685292.1 BatA and WFA domain-containing protein [Clostridium estertheticum]
MKLLSPLALWFLVLIPLLILMYILKQKFQEREISSLYLWHQVLLDTKAATPFQRFRRNILFFLQLLILLLVIFSLTKPFLLWNNKNYENVVMVIDTTGSMSALWEKDSRLDEAKKKATATVNSLASGSKITIISSGKNSRVEVSGSTDKSATIKKIKEIKGTNSAGNIDEVNSLVKAICKEYKSYKVIFFTDKAVNMKEVNGEVVDLATKRNNMSLDYIAHSQMEKGLKVMVRVTNHGDEDNKIELCLYGETKLVAYKDLNMKASETQTVYFENVPQNNKYIYGEISEKDALMEDNSIYSIVKQSNAGRILLCTDGNVFLEKAITTLKDIELFKSSSSEKVPPDFDLYIFDGKVPETLPKKGSMLFINPNKSNEFFKVSEEVGGGTASVVTHAITKYMGNGDFIISKLRQIETPYWGNPLLKVGEKQVSFVGAQKDQKIGVLGFDLHNTDLPLTTEFPIFINNLISYLIDRDTLTVNKYNCGESVNIIPLPQAEKINVITPDKIKEAVSTKYPVKPFEDTAKPGIYEIKQKLFEKEDSKLIAINFPSSESDISVQKSSTTNTFGSLLNKGGIDLSSFLLILALMIIIIEWLVYTRS